MPNPSNMSIKIGALICIVKAYFAIIIITVPHHETGRITRRYKDGIHLIDFSLGCLDCPNDGVRTVSAQVRGIGDLLMYLIWDLFLIVDLNLVLMSVTSAQSPQAAWVGSDRHRVPPPAFLRASLGHRIRFYPYRSIDQAHNHSWFCTHPQVGFDNSQSWLCIKL